VLGERCALRDQRREARLVGIERALSYGSGDITRASTATQGHVGVSSAPAATT